MAMLLAENIRKRLVLGTAGLAGVWGPVDELESIKVIQSAIDMGIDHFDTAPAYADAEILLSKALRKINFKNIKISTKTGKKKSIDPDSILFDYSEISIRNSVQNSLELFSADSLDILFLHDPAWVKHEELESVVNVMLDLKAQGLVKSLGIGGNYNTEFEPFAVSGNFDYFMGYNRFNIIKQPAAIDEFPKLKDAGVKIWQASPLYMGLLGKRFDTLINQKPEWIPNNDLEKAIALMKYCSERKLSMPGIALNYIMASNNVDRMVIGASSLQELSETVAHLSNAVYQELAHKIHEIEQSENCDVLDWTKKYI